VTTITINKPPKQAHRVRKKLLATGLTVTTALTTGFAAADPITVVSRVGSYGAAQDAALFTDASKNSGIEIIGRVSNGSYLNQTLAGV
jgi:spermidine/putrescine-binding protein